MEKTYCQLSYSGSSWSSYPEVEQEDEAEVENNNGVEAEQQATRLRRKEMQLFGHCPAYDNFSLVTCRECGRILKTSLFTTHCENFHRDLVSAINLSLASSTMDVKRTKNFKVIQPQVILHKLSTTESMDIDTGDVKIEEAPIIVPKLNHAVVSAPITAALNNVSNHSIKKTNTSKKIGKDSPRKVLLTKDREYDPNRHCGVWVQEMNKNCTRSLTCKTHALSLRRDVPGRRKQFDILLSEHRERVNLAKEQQQLLLKAQSLVSNSNSDINSGNKFSDQRNAFSNQGFNGDGQVNKDVASSLAYKSQHSNLEEDESDLPYLNSHPKPMTYCRFGARRAGKGCHVFSRKSDHLRTTVLSMVERLLHPSQPRQTVGKHSVHRKYNIKTAGQSSNQGSNTKTDIPARSRIVTQSSSTLSSTGSTIFRNSTKPKIARQLSTERNTHHSNTRTSKHVLTNNTLVQSSAQGTNHGQRLTNVKDKAISETSSTSSGGGEGILINSDAYSTQVGQTISTTELESSLTFCKDLGITDTSTGSTISTVILNGPIGSSDILTNHVQTSGLSTGSLGSIVKHIAPAPSPRTSYIVPASPSPPASAAYHKNSQSSTPSPQMSPLVNGTVPSPPPNVTVKGYPCNFVGKTTHLKTKGLASNTGVTHSVTNFTQGQTLVFANTNISQLQAQQITQPVVNQISQGKTLSQSNLFQRPDRTPASPGRPSRQSPSPQLPSPGRQSPQQRSPSNASPKYQHSLYLNHQHVPSTSQAPIAQLKQQVENQNQQLQQIKFQQLQQQQQQQQQQQLQPQQLQPQQLQTQQLQTQQLQTQQQLQQLQQQQQQQQSHLQQQAHHQHKQPTSQFRSQPRIAPAPAQPVPGQQTTYLLQQSQPNHTLSIRQTNGQVLKTPNTVFITNDNPPREIQFAVSRNTQANTVG